MKNTFFILLWSFTVLMVIRTNAYSSNNKSNLLSDNQIDHLKNTMDVIRFIQSLDKKFINGKLGTLTIKSDYQIINELNQCELYQKWGIKNWTKKDLNNDHHSDLLVTAFWYSNYHQYAVLYTKTKGYDIKLLTSNIKDKCKIVKPIITNNKNELLIHTYKTDAKTIQNDEFITYTDTLIYKFNEFIEKNTNPIKNDKIKSVIYTFDKAFEIILNNNGTVQYTCFDPIVSKELELPYSSKSLNKNIEANKIEDIESLVNYINIKNLPNDFSVDAYDVPIVNLKINYIDGSYVEIKDRGLQGTYGLLAIYSKIEDVVKQIDF
jgi:hypothetical protein